MGCHRVPHKEPSPDPLSQFLLPRCHPVILPHYYLPSLAQQTMEIKDLVSPQVDSTQTAMPLLHST